MNTLQEFEDSLKSNQPPAGMSVYLKSLWYDAKGDWDAAHHLVDNLSGADGSAVHAYLHRVEGDSGNAAYWYSRAGKKVPGTSLKQEWKELVDKFLERG